MSRARSHSMGLLLLLLGCAWVARCGLSCFSTSAPQSAPGLLERAGLRGRAKQARTRLAARGGEAATLSAATSEEEGPDSVQVGGFSALVVGLALLPYVVYCLVVVFDATVGGKELAVGPYGLELIACITTVCLTIWSVGSYVQRGCGLPAGPLGLLGLAEGLSYLGSLGLAIVVVAAYVRTGGLSPGSSLSASPSPPTVSSVKAPEFKAPDLKAPSIKVPEFKAPDIKVPAIKAPELPKVPEVKVPEVPKPKAPEAPKPKAPEVAPKPAPAPEAPKPKAAEVAPKPAPAPETPKPKAPEAAPKPAPAPEAPKPKAPEAAPKPAPAPEAAKKAPATATVVDDYSDLFN